MKRAKVIIIGGGFGGMNTAKALKDAECDIVLIDKTNHHLFQPLLYQVATAALSPGDIASSIRGVFRNQDNVVVYLDEVLEIDKTENCVKLENGKVLDYDYLIVATGSSHSYFGNDQWAEFAPGLKTLSDALSIREKILTSLEEAEKSEDLSEIDKYLTYVIIGGGPTGVELAGAIAEITKKTMIRDYKKIDTSKTKILLVEGSSRILSMYPNELSLKAKNDLEEIGVKVLLNKKVTDITKDGVKMGNEFIPAANIIWAAGNIASPLLKSLSTKLDKSGRAIVEKDLSVSGFSNLFVIGDAALYENENGVALPGIAPVAIQQGKYVAKIISEGIVKNERKPFIYNDRGIMATIGRAKAIAYIKGFKLSGITAWLTWSFIHVLFLIGFRNRFRVMAEWMWYYLTMKHGIRLITGKNKVVN